MSESVTQNVTIQGMAPGYAMRSRKSSWATFLLAGFFGFFGIHRFYLGHIGLGILYLLTFGLFTIGGIVDFIAAWHITRNENERRGYGRVDR